MTDKGVPLAAGVAPETAEKTLLDKCRRFTRVEELKAAGLYPYFRTIETAQDTEVVVDGQRMLMLGSNSYLGLTNHPKIKERIVAAVREFGSGCAGSRFLNGTLSIHRELEERLARLMGKEAAIAFSTGFQANLGAISALVAKDEAVILDKSDHASIVDGCRLSYGRLTRFRHNDMGDLERILKVLDHVGKLVVVDGVFSMEGDVAPLPDIVDLCEAHGAAVMVDDAHGVGVLGKTGAGTCEHFGLTDRVDVIMGTFSKSLASVGGYIAGDLETVDFIMHHARPMIFSASVSPANAAAVLGALDILEAEPERRAQLWSNTKFFKDGLKTLGLDTGQSTTPVIPLMVRDDIRTFKLWRVLHDQGLFVNAIVPPAVAPANSLLRLSLMATHTRPQLERALEVIGKACRQVGLI
ncbi:MAG: pyridoxal phosphate-dependent aminotransferase family protein [Elusimicrobia bacterium]|nr:pyridoxal phosphate-dependent aminotransferase family protein [Elusimicrobiota bacterium]